jgi:3-oxoacyl-[acyl-carrier-protein] synthase I
MEKRARPYLMFFTMNEVFIIGDNIYSPLAPTAGGNFAQLLSGVSGIKKHEDASMSALPFYAALFNKNDNSNTNAFHEEYTRFESLLIASVSDALKDSGISTSGTKTILIISSTKGNISLLESAAKNDALTKRIALSTSAKRVAGYFNLTNEPIVISNACISGILAIITGMRLLRAGQYENAIVVGADVISQFVLSGFQSFQAISNEHCRPFDAARKGINLGEGAGTVVLSIHKKDGNSIKVLGGSVSNDANHISGPSRTGQELHQAIAKTIQDAKLAARYIDFISAHGTATLYNDEMEAKAIALSGLETAPINSLKGYYGHTLGAAGIIESIASIHSLKANTILPTRGFETMGVTAPVTICSSLKKKSLHHCLKTASGFGGCNAAVLFSKQ